MCTSKQDGIRPVFLDLFSQADNYIGKEHNETSSAFALRYVENPVGQNHKRRVKDLQSSTIFSLYMGAVPFVTVSIVRAEASATVFYKVFIEKPSRFASFAWKELCL